MLVRHSKFVMGRHYQLQNQLFRGVMLLGVLAVGWWFCLVDGGAFPPFDREEGGLELAGQVHAGPGGMTITPKGDYILSLHQFFQADDRVVKMTRDGKITPFPNAEMNSDEGYHGVVLDSVLGVQCDAEGIVWMLDNGRRGEQWAKLVAWDTENDQLHRVITIMQDAVLETSFLAGLALDPEAPFIYITDPASGSDAALIVVDLRTGLCRRVLQGHYSVVPQSKVLLLEGKPVEVKRPDGSNVQPLAGANPIVVDRRGHWIYYGPMNGSQLFRITTENIRNPDLFPLELEGRVEGYGFKPYTGCVSIDGKGNIYFCDIGTKSIGYLAEKDRRYYTLVQDERMSWPDGLCFGTDGKLHFFCSQLNRTPVFNGGEGLLRPPYQVFKVQALSSGTVGR